MFLLQDRSTIMGYSYPTAPRRGLNAVHRLSIGMRDGNSLDVAPGFSGDVSLFALHFPDSELQPLVKIASVVTSSLDTSAGRLYISFRSNVAGSYESDLAKDLGGVLGKKEKRRK